MIYCFVHVEGIRKNKLVQVAKKKKKKKKKTKLETQSDNKGLRHWKKLLEDSVEFEPIDICRKAYGRNC